MKIAIAGKGGSGKTTIAGTLARTLARSGDSGVLAIDADSNPNLGVTLGLSREEVAALRTLDRSIVERVTDSEGKTKAVLTRSAEEIVKDYSAETPDGVSLLMMGRVEHAGAG
ncbi:MAG: AAA family ATPase [Acidobacteriota bacterium]|nr:AAA family ATPase [Acidobacteriota bacterium]